MKSMTKKLLVLITSVLLIAIALSSCGIDSVETNEVSDEARTKFIKSLIFAEDVELLYGPQIVDLTEDEETYGHFAQVPTNFEKVSKSDGGTSGLTDMYLLMKNDNYQLYFDFKTTDVAVKDMKTGNVFHSNPKRDPGISSFSTANQQNIASPLILEAYDASGKRYSFNFYGNCWEDGTGSFYVVKTGENTLRLVYTIGNDPDKDLFPPVITEDTYNNRILKGLEDKYLDGTIDEDQYLDYVDLLERCYRYMTPKDITVETKERFKSTFPTIDVMTLYVSYEGTSTKLKKNIKGLMETIGFTVKDVKKEMEKADYQGPERSVLYTIPVDLTLNNDGLSVDIDTSLILGPTKQRLYTINVYRGFGANGGFQHKGVDKNGKDYNYTDAYMIVPDGSGATIPLTGKLTADVFKNRIYGADGSFSKEYDMSYAEQVLAPYIIYDRDNLSEKATRYNAGGVIAVMKDGAAQASVVARPKSGNANPVASVNYEVIYSERDYRTYSTSYAVGAAEAETGSGLLLSKYAITGHFSIQYLFTEGGLTYSDYAKILRDYFIKEGMFPAETLSETELPLYVDLLGCVDLNQTFLGIPVQSETALTTYSQAKEILSKLKEAGVNNVVARYSYWANGGENNFMASDLELLSCMGAENDLKALIQYCDDNNMGFFPSVEFLHVTNTDNGFSTSQDAARRMNRSTATIVSRMNAIGSLRDDLEEQILVSSKVAAEISATYKTSFEEVFTSKNIALGNLGKDLHSNYKTNEGVTRSWAEKDHVKILQNFEGYNIAVSTGNFYTWNYANHIFGLPVGSSEYLFESAAIPFTQMLLHGYVNYSLDPVNQTGDYKTALLLALETGAAPSFRWMGAEDSIFDYTSFYNYFSLNYTSTIDRAVALYKEAASVLNDVLNDPITKHEALDAYYVFDQEGKLGWVMADPDKATGLVPVDENGNYVHVHAVERNSSDGGVFATVYGDKKVVVVNYNPFAVELNDRTVVEATSYKVFTLAEYEAIINGSAYEPAPVVPAPVEEPSDNGQEG